MDTTQHGSGHEYSGVEAFIALNILGTVLFVLTVIAASIAQRRGSSRHPTFFSFCIAWIVFCVSYALLYFAGQQAAFPGPDHNLCVAHSALVYSAPPLASSATVCLVTHLMLNILLALSSSAEKRRSLCVSTALVITPWIIWIAVFVGVLLYGFQHAERVKISPNGTFCVLIETELPKLTSIWATLLSIVLVSEEAVIGVLLYRNRDMFHGLGQSVTMAIRIAIFTILGIGAIAVALVYTVTERRGIQFDLLIAAIPPGAAVIFGSQKDLLQVWIFWKKFEYMPASLEATNNTAVLSTILSSRSIDSINGTTSRTYVTSHAV